MNVKKKYKVKIFFSKTIIYKVIADSLEHAEEEALIESCKDVSSSFDYKVESVIEIEKI